MKRAKTQNNDDRLEGYRNEIKIPLDRQQFEAFLPSLNGLGIFQVTAFPDRHINSVYFDTTDFSDYNDNISGIATRRKTRVRWYNNDLSRLTLEQKIKNNKASRKELIRLSNPTKIYPGTARGIRDILDANDKVESRALLETVRPVVEVEYNRNYFKLSPDLRMTIDRQQSFRRLYPSPLPHSVTSPVYAVVEFKYPSSDHYKVKAFLRDIPYRVFRHSKYVIGMDCTAL